MSTNDPLRPSVLHCAKWPLQNVWHTRLTDPRQFDILYRLAETRCNLVY
jgi:hypothetical protein